ncbi:hypothetical protein Csac_3022 [Caldicellulosiruptor saccharolyticus DSM 8903]|uniref:Uncharacterized protein n=1 Tax=Caldicellulosiruptor saccharolyticus (strain ATCC 43494 / DSM 8903 / Tp8T 6331) TaxID=351627 RepID=G2JCG8_CALS8|nr:hypothetical protein [Caldicellulosiruptor saccharolyticus]AEN71918.1 hypothetical protein Csac_3022 [Caldicellulosiruptor saccharolyticus DSM 8903]
MLKMFAKLHTNLIKLKKNTRGEGLLVFLGLIVIIIVILGIIYAIAPNQFQNIINRVFQTISSWFGG